MYDNYIAVDWAQSNMAIARMPKEIDKISVTEGPARVRDLQLYLGKLKGTKILTIEESTPSQWLYTELKGCVDEIIVCDPYRWRRGSQTGPLLHVCMGPGQSVSAS